MKLSTETYINATDNELQIDDEVYDVQGSATNALDQLTNDGSGSELFQANGEAEDGVSVEASLTQDSEGNVTGIDDIVVTVSEAAQANFALRNVSNVHSIELSQDLSSSINYDGTDGTESDVDQLANLNLGEYTVDSVDYTSSASGEMSINGSADTSITNNLTVNTPSASVTNNVNVGGDVNIEDVEEGTWNENASGNNLVITDSDATVKISGDAESVEVDETAGTNNTIDVSGSVSTLTANQSVTVTGASNINTADVQSEGVTFDESPENVDGSESPQIGDDENTVTATSQDTLQSALSGDAEVIELGSDIELTEHLNITREDVTIEGNGNQISVSGNQQNVSTGNPTIYVKASGVTIQNLNVVRSADANRTANDNFAQGIKIEAESVTVENTTVTAEGDNMDSNSAGIYIDDDVVSDVSTISGSGNTVEGFEYNQEFITRSEIVADMEEEALASLNSVTGSATDADTITFTVADSEDAGIEGLDFTIDQDLDSNSDLTSSQADTTDLSSNGDGEFVVDYDSVTNSTDSPVTATLTVGVEGSDDTFDLDVTVNSDGDITDVTSNE
ncbi:hypothetical protein EU245_14285 [Lentibacillus lipolyticus]|nr:hypothetical protein EU245_14285 [Lentibacillus lipolyticus]